MQLFYIYLLYDIKFDLFSFTSSSLKNIEANFIDKQRQHPKKSLEKPFEICNCNMLSGRSDRPEPP